MLADVQLRTNILCFTKGFTESLQVCEDETENVQFKINMFNKLHRMSVQSENWNLVDFEWIQFVCLFFF